MIIATIVNKKVFASYEYACALAICAGLILFALADYTLDPMKFDVMGLALVSASVVADAILPNAQECLFRGGSSRLEVTVYSNLFSFLGMTVVTLASGTLVQFAKWLYADSTLTIYFAVYTLLSYASISCYMTLVKRFGGVHAVLLTTARKAMTLVLSFLLFPKGFSWLYVYGSLLVLGAVMVASIMKKRNHAAKQKQSLEKYDTSYRDNGDLPTNGS
jgi:adenosine 3'-phospho 5'-phosphosulfate transporter B3